jgi:myosin heavy subunit
LLQEEIEMTDKRKEVEEVIKDALRTHPIGGNLKGTEVIYPNQGLIDKITEALLNFAEPLNKEINKLKNDVADLNELIENGYLGNYQEVKRQLEQAEWDRDMERGSLENCLVELSTLREQLKQANDETETAYRKNGVSVRAWLREKEKVEERDKVIQQILENNPTTLSEATKHVIEQDKVIACLRAENKVLREIHDAELGVCQEHCSVVKTLRDALKRLKS